MYFMSPRVLIWLSSVWLILMLIGNLFRTDILGGVSLFPLSILGIALFACLLYSLIFGKADHGRILVPLVFIPSLMLFTWATDIPNTVSTHFKLWRNEPEYLQIVNGILSSPDSSINLDTTQVFVDPGPPKRIAIVWDGMLGEWGGIIYDSSGSVPNLLNSKITVPSSTAYSDEDHTVNLFGSQLVSADHLWGHWYYCWFR
jgi:hypothetical protein